MTLYDLCAKLFLYLATFNRRARHGDEMNLVTVRNELDAIFAEQSLNASRRPQLMPLYQEVEYALAVTADEILINSRWTHAREWEEGDNLLEFRKFHTRVAGVEFWERLRKVSDARPDVLEIYYCCLCLGFRGMVRGDAEGFRRERQNLYHRLAGRMTRDERRLFPRAYEYTVTRDFTKPAALKLVRLLIVAVGFGLVYLAGSHVAWNEAVQKILELAADVAKMSAAGR
jgi:type IV/VI secretion system ImpK/VasF family protein